MEIIGNRRIVALLFFGLLAAALVFSHPSYSQTTVLNSQLIPFGTTVRFFGGYAYVLSVNSAIPPKPGIVEIFDISSATYKLVKTFGVKGYVSSAFYHDLAIAGHYAYILTTSGMEIYDLSDPVNPVFITAMASPNQTFAGIEVVGNYAYVVDDFGHAVAKGYDSLKIFDISNPARPQQVASLDIDLRPTLGGSLPFAIDIQGNYAYVAHRIYGYNSSSISYVGPYGALQVLDISNPSNPKVLGLIRTNQIPQDLRVAGNYVYLVDDTTDLQIFDVSDPANPTLANSVTMPLRGLAVFAENQRLHITGVGFYPTGSVSGFYDGLMHFDISDPVNPKLGCTDAAPSRPVDAEKNGNYIFVVDFGGNSLLSPSYLRLFGVDCASTARPASAPGLGTISPLAVSLPSSLSGLTSLAPLISGTGTVLPPPCPLPVEINPLLAKTLKTGSAPQRLFAAASVDLGGQSAYVANWVTKNLQIYDILDPSSAAEIGSVTVGSSAYGVKVFGTYAFVTDPVGSSVRIVDISNPAIPKVVGSIPAGHDPRPLAIYGNYLYVGDLWPDNRQILVFDISNPAAPVAAGAITSNIPWSLFVSGQYLYVASYGSNELEVFNLANPAHPLLAGRATAGAEPISVSVSGSYAYVANFGANTIQIFDVSNPAQPKSVGLISSGGNYPRSVTAAGNFVYAVNGLSNSLVIYNAADPSKPVMVGQITTDTNPDFILIGGTAVYVTTSESLQIFDVSKMICPSAPPSNPVLIGTANTGPAPQNVLAGPNYDLVTDVNSHALEVISVSDPAQPKSVGFVILPGDPRTVGLVDSRAIVADWGNNTLDIVDISDPANPRLVKTIPVGAGPWDLKISGNYLYLIDYTAGLLEIFDISNPDNPIRIGNVNIGAGPFSIFIKDNFAYITEIGTGQPVGNGKLLIVDISNPAQPTIIGSADTGNNPRSVVIAQDNLALVANWGSSTLQVINVSDPKNPITVSTLPVGQNPRSAEVSNNFIYLVNSGSSNLQVINISNPTNPKIDWTVATGQSPRSIDISNGLASIANSDSNSVQVWNIGGSLPVIPGISAPVAATGTYQPPIALPNLTPTLPGALTLPGNASRVSSATGAIAIPIQPVPGPAVPVPERQAQNLVSQTENLITNFEATSQQNNTPLPAEKIADASDLLARAKIAAANNDLSQAQNLTGQAAEIINNLNAIPAPAPLPEQPLGPLPTQLSVTGTFNSDLITPKPADKFMTGGGDVKDMRHGFELHCKLTDQPDNLEINWTKGENFHLQNLTAANCFEDPAIREKDASVGFNTFIGSGLGTYDGLPGAKVDFKFTDAGEPGKNDSAQITITDIFGRTVFSVSGTLDSGNQQAHSR